MKLFRGIAVPADQLETVIADILSNGLIDQYKANWQMTQAHRLNNLQALHLKTDLSTADTRTRTEAINAVCACGDKEGALYYACRHNLGTNNNAPILIEFDVEMSSLAIDGKDFLFTTFQGANPTIARPILEKCFGKAILKYANRAWSSQDQSFRIAQCDLAIQDPAVIEAHYASDTVIAGRYNTIFRSAFTVKLPVLPISIVSIYSPNKFSIIPKPKIKLHDIIK